MKDLRDGEVDGVDSTMATDIYTSHEGGSRIAIQGRRTGDQRLPADNNASECGWL